MFRRGRNFSPPADLDAIIVRIAIDEGWEAQVDCPVGWYTLLVDLDTQLAALDPDYVIYCVREHMAHLQYEIALHDDEIIAEKMRALIHATEETAAQTCEQCGDAGEQYYSKQREPNKHTYCQRCGKKANMVDSPTYRHWRYISEPQWRADDQLQFRQMFTQKKVLWAAHGESRLCIETEHADPILAAGSPAHILDYDAIWIDDSKTSIRLLEALLVATKLAQKAAVHELQDNYHACRDAGELWHEQPLTGIPEIYYLPGSKSRTHLPAEERILLHWTQAPAAGFADYIEIG